MKKYLAAGYFSFFIITSAIAQPPKTPPKEFPTTIPKHQIGQPAANIKTYPALTEYLTGSWKGDIIWTTQEGGYSAAIRDISFSMPIIRMNYQGKVNWQISLQQIVPPQEGSYVLTGNKISFTFNYPPYSYLLNGEYNKYLGTITGTFTQTRASYPNPPAGYTTGTISGTFTLTKK
jgi:hypothetical protein